MSAPSAVVSPPPMPPALAAFIAGVARRGAVLAELLAGSGDAGDRALAAALDAFAVQAPGHAVATWPARFWSLLLARPELRGAPALPWPGDLPLRVAGPGIRAAVLLRLVAQLDEAAAADVLGVAEGTLRRALEQAMPREADGRPDAAAWAALRGGLQQRVRGVSPARLQRLAALRGGARPSRAADAARSPSRPMVRRLLAVGLAAGLALAATAWMERRAGVDVEQDALAPAGEPASRYSVEAGLVAHPDFGLLADPATEAVAREVAFLSWSAAQADAAARAPDPSAASATMPAPVSPWLPTPGETTDAP